MNKIEEIYLDWFNHYASVSYMASDYGISRELMQDIIEAGKAIHHAKHRKAVQS
jgi:hypothetical protein